MVSALDSGSCYGSRANIYILRRYLQGPGSHISMRDVEKWPNRMLEGEELCMVGTAYHPYRAYSEGALVSASNALLEGWSIPIPSSPHEVRFVTAVNHTARTKLKVAR